MFALTFWEVLSISFNPAQTSSLPIREATRSSVTLKKEKQICKYVRCTIYGFEIIAYQSRPYNIFFWDLSWIPRLPPKHEVVWSVICCNLFFGPYCKHCCLKLLVPSGGLPLHKFVERPENYNCMNIHGSQKSPISPFYTHTAELCHLIFPPAHLFGGGKDYTGSF